MSARRAAWVACGLTVAIASSRLGLAIADPESAGPASDARVPGGGVPLAVVEWGVLSAFAVIGALVASRQPRNPVGWFLCATPFFLGVGLLAERVYWHLVLANPEQSGSAELVLWLSNWTWVPAMFPMFTLVPLLFPTGSPPTPRWRLVGWVATATGTMLLLALAFAPGPFDEYPWVDNPLGIEGLPSELLGGIGLPILLAASLASIASLVVRFRRSRGVERQQLKWVTAAAALLIVVWVLNLAVAGSVDDDWAWASLIAAMLAVAGAMAIAMLRYRLYDIDVVINRALVYGALTVALGAAYLATVLLLQLALEPLTTDSQLAVAGSTLAVAALFRPARRRIQGTVDRRFYRNRFDAQRTLEAFSSTLRDQVELDSLSGQLRQVVRDTMQPAHLSLWLRQPRSRS
jgi:hypothetical protein